MQKTITQMALPVAALILLTGADWTQFRGPEANGVSTETRVPSALDPQENIAWKAELPGRGLSGAIVVGERVFVTASSGFDQNRLHVLCFDAESGEKLWHRQFWATGRTNCHRKMCVATPTPASDGERIFAFYSSNDVICLDLDGNLQWFRGLTYDFPNASNSLGMASSPILVGETLIVQVENEATSLATGLDVATGRSRWLLDRPRHVNWTSPSILHPDDPENRLALLQSTGGLTAIEPATGEVAWRWEEGAATIPSSVVADGVVYVPSNGTTALQPPKKQGQQPEVLWNSGRLSPSMASPVVYQGRIYTVNRAGVLTCGSLETGERLWQLRLKGPFSGTPVAAGGHLYFFSEKGLAQIVSLGDEKGEVIGRHDFGETFLATPAVADGAVYIRSDAHLWKITP